MRIADALWNDRPCSNNKGRVCRIPGTPPPAVCGDGVCAEAEQCPEDCEVTLPETCEPVGTTSDGDAFVVCTDVSDWSSARLACQKIGGDLASIHNEEEQGIVSGGVQGVTSAWIGFTDSEQEGVWTWSDGTSSAYTNWNAIAPDDFGDGEDCAEVRIADALWNDRPCSNNKGRVCRIDASTLPCDEGAVCGP